jgi:lysozyme
MTLQALKNKTLAENANIKAFLLMIRVGEGTQYDDGFNYLFGSRPDNDIRFCSFAKHPNIKRPFGSTYSTAAGAYQFLYKTWIEVAKKLKLTDFSPESQTIAAIEKIRERGALQLVLDGKFVEAVKKCAKEWASLPYSPYGQPTRTIAQARESYLEAGGKIS